MQIGDTEGGEKLDCNNILSCNRLFLVRHWRTPFLRNGSPQPPLRRVPLQLRKRSCLQVASQPLLTLENVGARNLHIMFFMCISRVLTPANINLSAH